MSKDRDYIREQEDLTESEIRAVEVVEKYGWIDGVHHKLWCLHEIVREILGTERYVEWAAFHNINTDECEEVGSPP